MVRRLPVRRLARHLFTVCSAGSLLLCMAVCVLWVRSYRYMDRLDWLTLPSPTALRERQVQSVGGRVAVAARDVVSHNPDLSPMPEQGQPLRYAGGPVDAGTRATLGRKWDTAGPSLLGLRLRRETRSRPPGAAAAWTQTLHVVVVPYAYPGALFGLLPAFWLGRRLAARRRKRRGTRGLCPSRGYDVRASPERCPECGVATARPAGTA